MKKSRKILIYVLAAIISFLIIPEVILRKVPNDILARLSDFTSLGGLFSPFLSAMIFIGLSSIFIGIIGVYVVGKVCCALTQIKHE
ncbi:hypothetical protein POH93_11870 [Phytobacter diazotrophicus]|uniref:hypothetical protein n=1 Tax=Phytobacter diazotrophicus TaxID=395631 RepID=UPI00232D2A2B|nr:hypothetical protein [Phytobacter diazotrophicus]MDC0726087.1 hypothetical protein [Phytobacter diazotrophicus]MDC0733451.1 hypothetical protein [Phytobacter diazotrophicus]